MTVPHSERNHLQPHHALNAMQQGKKMFARNEDRQHDERCRDDERGGQRRGKKVEESIGGIADRDEAVHTKKKKRGRRVTFFVIMSGLLILLGEGLCTHDML